MTKWLINSERFMPRLLANASAFLRTPRSSEMLIFLAPWPILGRPRRTERSAARSAAGIGRAFSNAKGWEVPRNLERAVEIARGGGPPLHRSMGGAGNAFLLSSASQMQERRPSIPEFPADGYLPEGLFLASDAEVIFRFGSSTRRRRRLVLRLRRWLELARDVGGRRLLIDGSFVTAKEEPDDIDAVILLPRDFQSQLEQGKETAIELEEMLLTRRPEEIFAAEDEADWNEWFEFFSRTREADGRRKGLVEIAL